MQSALDVCFRGAFLTCNVFILTHNYVYDTSVGFCMRYKIRVCVLNVYDTCGKTHGTTRLILKLDLKLNQNGTI